MGQMMRFPEHGYEHRNIPSLAPLHQKLQRDICPGCKDILEM